MRIITLSGIVIASFIIAYSNQYSFANTQMKFTVQKEPESADKAFVKEIKAKLPAISELDEEVKKLKMIESDLKTLTKPKKRNNIITESLQQTLTIELEYCYKILSKYGEIKLSEGNKAVKGIRASKVLYKLSQLLRAVHAAKQHQDKYAMKLYEQYTTDLRKISNKIAELCTMLRISKETLSQIEPELENNESSDDHSKKRQKRIVSITDRTKAGKELRRKFRKSLNNAVQKATNENEDI